MQHGIIGCRKESQISEPGDATIREKAPNPFHLFRREAVSFANLKTFVPGLSFADSLLDQGAFHSDVWSLPIARGIEADPMLDTPSRASFGKVGSIMKRLRVPIDRHADGQLTEVLRKIVLVVPYRRGFE